MKDLEILVSAVDDASETLESIGTSVSDLSESVSASSTAMEASFNELAEAMATDSADISEEALAVGNSFNDAMAQITEDTTAATDAVASMDEETSSSTGNMRANFLQLGIVAGGAFYGLTSALGTSLSEADQWNQTSAVIGQVLQDTGSKIPLAQIQAYAQSMQNTTLYTQQAALSSSELIMSHQSLQSSYQDILNVAADVATKTGQDLPSATRVLTTALTDPVAGVNQLVRVLGADLSAAQVAAIQAMTKTGDVAGADALIMQTLKGSIGGAAEAADKSAQAWDKAQQSIGKLGQDLGNALLPAINKMVEALAPLLTEFDAWINAHPKLAAGIAIALVAILGIITALAAIGVLVLTITPALTALGTVAAVVGGVFAGITLPIFAMAAALVALIAVVALVIKYHEQIWDEIQKVWGEAATFVSKQLDAIKNFVTGKITEVVNFMTTQLNNLKTGWETVWTGMSNFLTTIWTGIKNTVKAGIDDLIAPINAFIGAIDSIHISIPSINILGIKTPALNLGFSIPQIPMLADGGIVDSPTLALIGEAGPEAVVPLSQLSSMAGAQGNGGGTNVVVNLSGTFYTNQSSARSMGNTLATAIQAQLRLKRMA